MWSVSPDVRVGPSGYVKPMRSSWSPKLIEIGLGISSNSLCRNGVCDTSNTAMRRAMNAAKRPLHIREGAEMRDVSLDDSATEGFGATAAAMAAECQGMNSKAKASNEMRAPIVCRSEE